MKTFKLLVIICISLSIVNGASINVRKKRSLLKSLFLLSGASALSLKVPKKIIIKATTPKPTTTTTTTTTTTPAPPVPQTLTGIVTSQASQSESVSVNEHKVQKKVQKPKYLYQHHYHFNPSPYQLAYPYIPSEAPYYTYYSNHLPLTHPPPSYLPIQEIFKPDYEDTHTHTYSYLNYHDSSYKQFPTIFYNNNLNHKNAPKSTGAKSANSSPPTGGASNVVNKDNTDYDDGDPETDKPDTNRSIVRTFSENGITSADYEDQ